MALKVTHEFGTRVVGKPVQDDRSDEEDFEESEESENENQKTK